MAIAKFPVKRKCEGGCGGRSLGKFIHRMQSHGVAYWPSGSHTDIYIAVVLFI